VHGDLKTVVVIMEGADGSILRNTCGQLTDWCRVVGTLAISGEKR
jgi:hypothetical protein